MAWRDGVDVCIPPHTTYTFLPWLIFPVAVEIEHLKESHFGRTVATLKKHPREVMSRCHGSPFKSPGQNIKAAFVSLSLALSLSSSLSLLLLLMASIR